MQPPLGNEPMVPRKRKSSSIGHVSAMRVMTSVLMLMHPERSMRRTPSCTQARAHNIESHKQRRSVGAGAWALAFSNSLHTNARPSRNRVLAVSRRVRADWGVTS